MNHNSKLLDIRDFIEGKFLPIIKLELDPIFRKNSSLFLNEIIDLLNNHQNYSASSHNDELLDLRFIVCLAIDLKNGIKNELQYYEVFKHIVYSPDYTLGILFKSKALQYCTHDTNILSTKYDADIPNYIRTLSFRNFLYLIFPSEYDTQGKLIPDINIRQSRDNALKINYDYAINDPDKKILETYFLDGSSIDFEDISIEYDRPIPNRGFDAWAWISNEKALEDYCENCASEVVKKLGIYLAINEKDKIGNLWLKLHYPTNGEFIKKSFQPCVLHGDWIPGNNGGFASQIVTNGWGETISTNIAEGGFPERIHTEYDLGREIEKYHISNIGILNETININQEYLLLEIIKRF
jgi:hypothetical protein